MLPPLPPPGEVGSHALYVDALREEEETLAAELLARYERRIAEAPNDAVAAVERCRFLAAAFYDPETEENPREEERLACVADVERRFAEDPAARVFVIEERWGEEAREAGVTFLAEPPAAAEPNHLAAVHAHLAAVFESEESEDAVSHAEQAMALDPSLDLRLLVARGKSDSGDREGARSVLIEGLLSTSERWELEQKASLLTDLEDFEAALSAFRELERRGDASLPLDDHARALAGAGDIGAARAAWAKLGKRWLSDESLRARFEFELAHGDDGTARAAYDALLARGWEVDPVGRDRLALLLAHPGAPWKLEDATGLAVLVLLGFFVSLLPALWILPVAWAGLSRNRSLTPAETKPGFGLHQAWAVSAVYLIAECLVVVAYHDNFPSGDYLVSMDQAVFARYALVSVVAALAAVLLVLRGRVVELLGSGDWTWKRTVMVGVAGAIVLRGAVWLVLRAVGAEGGDATTEEMMRSVNDHYGLDANLVLMALLTPLTEEIVFRGVLLSAFQRQLAPGWANFAQAALFGLAHAHPVVTPYTFAMGLVAGWMTRRSGTLRPALLMHVCNNAVACVALATAP